MAIVSSLHSCNARRCVVLSALGRASGSEVSDAAALVQRELRNGDHRKALALAAARLRAFGAARQVPQRIYTLEELRLNGIDTARFLSPVDFTLGTVRRNLQLAALAGGIAAWQLFHLDQFQLLIGVVVALFVGTLDQIVYNGGVEALLLDTLGRVVSGKYKNRVAQHEAGHFLVAYLMGILPADYTLSSLDAFRKNGSLNVQAGTSFVDFEFQEEVSFKFPASKTLNKYACVALAGVATEFLKFGLAEGGLSDIQQLDELLKRLNFTQLKADSQVRWAVLNTVSILRRHLALHSKLAEAMDAGKSVGQCIELIETELAGCTDL
ncbi:hypothetical protein SELMODRAFT_168681 [Selaginella moellendorffii]|uniref:Peptidase M41 domain-containing protein n=1 Tax=Selaginella moellendorffii TaxID=88036 RepID=D8R793_SELML|nr:hypothetical protein SELMODRAFT_168681 [Selaginella moellendorffii]